MSLRSAFAVLLILTLAQTARAQTTPAPTTPASTTSVNVDLENWMATLPGVADLPLTSLPIPGTHDSGSYSITSHSPWALTGKSDFGMLSKLPGFLVKPTAEDWSRTQPKPLFWQFAEGIRSVDLRLSNEPDGIYIEHGLRGATIDEVLNDVALFAELHPKEILFVAANRFTNFDTTAHAALVQKIRATLGSYLVPASVGTSATLSQIWALQRNVIFLYADAPTVSGSSGDFWTTDTIYGPWANVQKTDDLLQANQSYLAQRDPTRIWELSGTVTPDTGMILKGLAHDGPGSIEDLMKDVHPALQHWLRHELHGSVNLVMTDWYDAPWDGGSCFVRDVLASVDDARALVPYDVTLTDSGTHWHWFVEHTYADFEWEPVAGATDYEVRMDAASIFRPSTSEHSSTNKVHIERTNVLFNDFIAIGQEYDVSVRASVGGVWGEWSLAKRIRL